MVYIYSPHSFPYLIPTNVWKLCCHLLDRMVFIVVLKDVFSDLNVIVRRTNCPAGYEVTATDTEEGPHWLENPGCYSLEPLLPLASFLAHQCDIQVTYQWWESSCVIIRRVGQPDPELSYLSTLSVHQLGAGLMALANSLSSWRMYVCQNNLYNFTQLGCKRQQEEMDYWSSSMNLFTVELLSWNVWHIATAFCKTCSIRPRHRSASNVVMSVPRLVHWFW